MTNKINDLLKGKTFDELIEIYDKFTEKEFDWNIEMAIMSKMEKVDLDRFIKWAEEY